MTEEAPQRDYPLREVYNGLRYIVRGGIPWRMMPNDLPPWYTVYQQSQRWLNAGVFEAMVHDLRALMRLAAGRNSRPAGLVRFQKHCMQHRVAHPSPNQVSPGVKTMNTSGTANVHSSWRWNRCEDSDASGSVPGAPSWTLHRC